MNFNTLLLTPPVAFLIFVGLAALLNAFGKVLAGPEKPSEAKSSLYTGGEVHHTSSGAPGYRPFFLIALFFAILHLGVLMLGTGGLTWMSGLYLIGLIFALVALILG
jgi:NADH:ubiquinone oxidoreductase subunit 3 (subunit A)